MRFNEIFFLFPDLLHRAFTVFYYKSHRRSGRNFSGRVSNILKKLSLISNFWKYFTETWHFDETWSRTWWNSSAIYLYNLYCKTQKIYGTRCRNLIFYIKRFTKKANVNTYIFFYRLKVNLFGEKRGKIQEFFMVALRVACFL